MTTTTESNPIVEMLTKLGVELSKKINGETIANFRISLSKVDPAKLMPAAHAWLASGQRRLPTPHEIHEIIEGKSKVRPPETSGSDRPTYYVCVACGMRVETRQLESHASWCEFEVRRVAGNAPLDQMEVRLRALVTIRNTREDIDNLAAFRASKGMAV